jgi:hypothetical protein
MDHQGGGADCARLRGFVVVVIGFVLWPRYGEQGAQFQLDVIRTGGILAALLGGGGTVADHRTAALHRVGPGAYRP